jgi:hypothetical protein
MHCSLEEKVFPFSEDHIAPLLQKRHLVPPRSPSWLSLITKHLSPTVVGTIIEMKRSSRRRNQWLRWILMGLVLICYTRWSENWLLPISTTSSTSLASFNADLLSMATTTRNVQHELEEASSLSSSSSVYQKFTKQSPKPLTKEQSQQPRLFVHIGKAGGTSIQVMVQKSAAKCNELKMMPQQVRTAIAKTDRKTLPVVDDNDDDLDNDDLDDVKAQTCAIAQIQSKRVHLQAGQDKYSQYEQFLVNVRNPIDRLVSWYNYELQSFEKEPRWQQGGIASDNFRNLKDCFPQGIGQIVQQGLLSGITNKKTTNTTITTKLTFLQCRQLAKDCLKGDIMCFGHNFYNYEVYGEDLLLWKTQQNDKTKNIRIDIIRSEHSMDDFENIVQLWTEPVAASIAPPRDNRSYKVTNFVRGLYQKMRTIEHYQPKPNAGKQKKKAEIPSINKTITQEAVTALCRWICVELVTYKHLLSEADNLNEQEVRGSFEELDERCQLDVDKACGTSWEYRNIKQQKKVFDMPW